jgi:hypothetical protein
MIKNMPLFTRYVFVVLMLPLWCGVSIVPCLQAQTTAGEAATIESRYIVDMPTAGLLSKGKWSADVYAMGNSGVMVDVSLAPLPNFNVGLSYAGAGFLGNSGIRFQGLPGLHVRWRPVDETLSAPAVLVGVQTQGRGEPLGGNVFQTASPGVFVAVSKNFTFLGSLALHGTYNYTFDYPLNGRFGNFSVGFEKTIGSVVSLAAEYNATFDNPPPSGLGTMRQRGLLNAAVRVFTGKGFTFELQLRDLLRNLQGAESMYRTLRLEYVAGF